MAHRIADSGGSGRARRKAALIAAPQTDA
jgi:hypothetical protein